MQQAIIACKALQPAVKGACREIEPEALARLVGWKVTRDRAADALLALREESCRGGGGWAAQIAPSTSSAAAYA
jgi:hypothetical protein